MRSATAVLVAALASALPPAFSSAGELRDPTRPPQATRVARGPARATPLALEAVWISPERRVARIGGRDVEEGDTLGTAQVARIEAGVVTLVAGGEVRRITFTPSVIRPAEDAP